MVIRRSKKLIKSGLQLKMIAAFLFLACIAALFQVTLLNRSVMKLSAGMTTDGDQLLGALPGLLVSNLLWTLGVLAPVMLFTGIAITHRIAGPIYRFEQYFAAIAKGEQPGACKIRPKDELWALCDHINAAMEVIEANQAGQTTPQQLQLLKDQEEPLKLAE